MNIKESYVTRVIRTLREHQFMFEELVKRDFKQKYKRTVLGMAWSVLSPLLTLLVMRVVFTRFFGRDTPHYTTYLFAGNLMFSYFRESTNGGMQSLMSNASIFTKINVPKYMFLLSKNVSAVINFGLTLIVFFRDTQYLYDVFLTLLTYLSAIFYTIDRFPAKIQRVFLLNPVFCNIKYIRVVVIDGNLPSPMFHLLLLAYALTALTIGGLIYKKFNTQFLYYV